MKVLHINTFPYKATGNIMLNIHDELLKNRIESVAVWGRGREANSNGEFSIEDKLGMFIHGAISRAFDLTGYGSIHATKKLIRFMDRYRPDVIHIHNLHGYYVNIEMLFGFIKKNRIKVIWTFHDCWPMTGHCVYFDMIGCEKWKTGCCSCPQKKTYPASIFLDNSKNNWNRKKRMIEGVDIKVVTPSVWLKNIVKMSYFKDSEVVVINNGIDTKKFHPIDSDYRLVNKIGNKKIILGVASEWTERKGLHDFYRLNTILESNKYQIVLIGLNKEQLMQVPKGILAFERTSCIEELIKWYSCADYFFNPTYEDNYPTTNLEAQACGTFVITYDTGGSPETILTNGGIVFEKGELNEVVKFLKTNRDTNNLLSRVDVSKCNTDAMIKNYLSLYVQ